MIHLDFDWDVSSNGIILDPALDIDKLGWRGGDYFKLVNINGQAQLIKVDPIVPFLEGRAINKEQ
jgi:hypothetical protein